MLLAVVVVSLSLSLILLLFCYCCYLCCLLGVGVHADFTCVSSVVGDDVVAIDDGVGVVV